MEKYKQVAINNNVLCALNYYNRELTATGDYHRLNSCQAWWRDIINAKTGEVVGAILISYNTMVAFTINGVMYDFLRYVYGYTATSAQHIAKFRNFMKPYAVHTYRPV